MRNTQNALRRAERPTDIFSDTRIRKLRRQHGALGYAIYDYIVMEAARVRGAWVEWNDDLALDIAEYWATDEKTVAEVVAFCLMVGLWNKSVFERETVLTNAEMQQDYCERCRRSRRRADIPPGIALHIEEAAEPVATERPTEIVKTIKITRAKNANESAAKRGIANESTQNANESSVKRGIANERPRIANETPRIANERPQIANERPEIANESSVKRGIANETPRIANETPQIANENPKIANERPQIANERPQIANENPKIANDGAQEICPFPPLFPPLSPSPPIPPLYPPQTHFNASREIEPKNADKAEVGNEDVKTVTQKQPTEPRKAAAPAPKGKTPAVQLREWTEGYTRTVPEELRLPFTQWLDYRRHTRRTYTTTVGIMRCFERLRELSGGNPAAAAEIVQYSIAQGYQGLFAPRNMKTTFAPRPVVTQTNINDKWR